MMHLFFDNSARFDALCGAATIYSHNHLICNLDVLVLGNLGN